MYHALQKPAHALIKYPVYKNAKFLEGIFNRFLIFKLERMVDLNFENKPNFDNFLKYQKNPFLAFLLS
jgi:hypothetical protein